MTQGGRKDHDNVDVLSRWRAVNTPHLVALVRAGATFINGRPVERPDESEGQ